MKFLSIIAVLILSFSGFSQISLTSNYDSIDYRTAIKNAMFPDRSNIYNGLVSITKQNKELTWNSIDGEDFVLMVVWRENIAPYLQYKDTGYYNTGEKWPLWVTAAPELRKRMRSERIDDPIRRMKELLGYPPNSKYSHIVEFWVRPQDLFRPCPDNEISDKSCDICFPSNVDPAYMEWVNQTRINRYYQCDLYSQYPYTGLGYTYDWNPKNKTHVGLSEFVIKNNANIKVAGIYSTEDYLKKGR